MTRWLVAAMCLSLGCIKAPEIVLVDRATALEQQAAGSFGEIEKKIIQEGIVARPVPLTPDDMAALGIHPPSMVDEIDQTEADQVDALLTQHCVGESRDALLADTHDACIGAADQDAARVLIDRVNRARQQLWRFMQSRLTEEAKLAEPKHPAKVLLPDLRRDWRAAHLGGVVCGGWVQGDDGKWEAKKC